MIKLFGAISGQLINGALSVGLPAVAIKFAWPETTIAGALSLALLFQIWWRINDTERTDEK